MTFDEKSLSQKIRRAYEAGSSGGSDDWHPTVREKHEARMMDEIGQVLSETDFTKKENRVELSRLLTRLLVREAQSWAYHDVPSFNAD